MIGSTDELSLLFQLYGLGFVLIFATFALMYRHASRRATVLALDAHELHEAHMLKRHYAIFALVGALSIVAARLGIGLQVGFPGWMYALLGPLCWAHGVWSDRARPVAA